MKRKRQKIQIISDLIKKQMEYYFDMLEYKLDMPDVDWANLCDDVADDVITKLDDMEEDETDL